MLMEGWICVFMCIFCYLVVLYDCMYAWIYVFDARISICCCMNAWIYVFDAWISICCFVCTIYESSLFLYLRKYCKMFGYVTMFQVWKRSIDIVGVTKWHLLSASICDAVSKKRCGLISPRIFSSVKWQFAHGEDGSWVLSIFLELWLK